MRKRITQTFALTGAVSIGLLLSSALPAQQPVGIVAGSAAIGKLAANSGVDIGDVDVLTLPNVAQATAANLNAQVQGPAATDATVSGNPLLEGGRSEDTADSAPGVRVSAEGEAVPISVTRDGTQRVILGGPQSWSYHENSSSTLTDTTVHAAGGAGLYNYICTVVVSTGAATAFNMFIEDSTTTTILGPFYLEAVAGRGAALNFSPCKKQTNSNTLISVTTSAAIAHSIDITGYIAE
jgi:hypothetical protein